MFGQTFTGKAHFGTDVAERNTKFEIVFFARNVLHTGIQCKSARFELGMIKQDEVFVQIPEKSLPEKTMPEQTPVKPAVEKKK